MIKIQLKPGDVFLSIGIKILTKIVQVLTWPLIRILISLIFGHAGVYAGNNTMFEASTKGVRYYPLDSWLKVRRLVIIRFDNSMARLIYAGSDAFLMPSKYEPCGLGQLIAMKYGTLPVVHATGGLADTVRDIDACHDDGNGFSFHEYSSEALVETVARAIKAFRTRGRARWNKTVKRAMREDFSWERSGQKYLDLYHQIRNRKKS